jgi:hypothetical protein
MRPELALLACFREAVHEVADFGTPSSEDGGGVPVR